MITSELNINEAFILTLPICDYLSGQNGLEYEARSYWCCRIKNTLAFLLNTNEIYSWVQN